ncbi:MAG TPA: 3,4-dihydroxy-2-butanone-4-phosphate synthase [Stellaceae bacterium]|nr:3,4-dihydroxy-2-butanone-4-phosphate synthase [Stellaceae bacterium]
MSFHELVSPIEDVIADARDGKMFILVDEEDRENEGDLVIPAEKATPEVINFMAKNGRGLICLALTRQRVEELDLPLMPQHNAARLQTAFTVSIEARDGVTTGISAADRARTIAVAIDPAKSRSDLVTPGHVFPLLARDGGVLVRTGHTEAAVDIARLAGLNPSGVICEIMNDDGTMARRDDLIAFAQFHGLKIGTIADLIEYRRRNERLVECIAESEISSDFGGVFQVKVYVNKLDATEHLVLVKGDVAGDAPVPVRMHALNIFDDALGCARFGRGGELQTAMAMIGREGRGVIVILRESARRGVRDLVRQRDSGEPPSMELRDYGVGAQILVDLGVRQMVLLSNTPRTIVGLEGYGLTVVDRRPIVVTRPSL